MGILKALFGRKCLDSKSCAGICDLCSSKIDYGHGFVFYSSTVFPWVRSETGLMHICSKCCDEHITEEEYTLISRQSKSCEDLDNSILTSLYSQIGSNTERDRKLLRVANVYGIFKTIIARGVDFASAKKQAKELAVVLWKNKEQGISQALSFWK
jgi:hypothetical protein